MDDWIVSVGGKMTLKNPNFWADLLYENSSKFMSLLYRLRERRQKLGQVPYDELVKIKFLLDNYEAQKEKIFSLKRNPFSPEPWKELPFNYESIRRRELNIPEPARSPREGYTYDEHSD